MRLIAACLLFIIFSSKIRALEQLELKRFESSDYIFMRFDHYHVKFNEYTSIFKEEIRQQNLQEYITGKPFSVYFSEHDWAIACLVKKKVPAKSPLFVETLVNSHSASCKYDGENQNLNDLLSLMTSFIEKKGYQWDGPLIIKQLEKENSKNYIEIIIPVSRDLYKIWKKPHGLLRTIITFICLLLAIFLFTFKKGKKISNRLLGTFASICFLRNVNALFWSFELNYSWPHLINFTISLDFLFGPLLFFYIKSIIQKEFSFKKTDLLHFIPFVAVCSVYFFLFQVKDASVKMEMLHDGFLKQQLIQIIKISDDIHILTYLSLSIHYLLKNRFIHYKPNPLLIKRIIPTLKLLLYGLTVMQFISLVRTYVEIPVKNYIIFMSTLQVVSDLTFASLIVIRALRFPEIFSFSLSEANGRKYGKSPLNEGHKQFYLKKILQYMDGKKPYLSSEINLSTMAKDIAIPSRYLSQVLNEKMELSFYDFINNYRIREATKLLADPANSNCSIIDIAYDCGFNSKSVFHAAFKKNTGQTPKEYREYHLTVSPV